MFVNDDKTAYICSFILIKLHYHVAKIQNKNKIDKYLALFAEKKPADRQLGEASGSSA